MAGDRDRDPRDGANPQRQHGIHSAARSIRISVCTVSADHGATRRADRCSTRVSRAARFTPRPSPDAACSTLRARTVSSPRHGSCCVRLLQHVRWVPTQVKREIEDCRPKITTFLRHSDGNARRSSTGCGLKSLGRCDAWRIRCGSGITRDNYTLLVCLQLTLCSQNGRISVFDSRNDTRRIGSYASEENFRGQ